MADRWIKIAQIGEAHSHSAVADPDLRHSKGSSNERAVMILARGTGLDMAGRKRLGDQVRLVARMQLVAKILDMPLDRAWSDSKL